MTEARTEAHRLQISGAITIRDIDDVREKVLAGLGQSDRLEIDCSDVSETDISLIQLLLAAEISAAKSGKSIAVLRPYPEAIQQALTRGGFLDGTAAGGGNIWTKGE
ncbi:MAG TPA: STAS domain-containing protein [Dongiaceae bacterium]|jgi:ABC-type transporter Mla MlaB component